MGGCQSGGACGQRGGGASCVRGGAVSARGPAPTGRLGAAGAAGEMTALLVGLDNAGKTSVVRALMGADTDDTSAVPTVGFSAPAVISVGGGAGGGAGGGGGGQAAAAARLRLYDVGGGARIRALWPAFYADVHCVIFTVDSTDRARMREAAVELRRALAHPCVVGKPVLVLATKHDMPGALSAAAVAAALELDTAAGLNRHAVQPVVARAGAGAPPDPRLLLGLEWLVAAVRVDWRALDARRGREMAAAAAADATRRAARRSSAGATVAPAAPAALAPVSAPAPAAADSLVCSSCAVAPAARRCAAADWAAVCDDCGARLQRAAAARAAVAAAAADAAAAAAEPAPPVLVAPAAAHHTLEDSGCSFLTSPPSSPSLSLAAAVQTPDEGRRRPAAVAVGAGGGADASTGGSPLPAVASLRVTPADDGACCASCRAAPATCRTKLLQVTDDAVTGSDGRWSPACAACAAAADAVRGGAVAAALRAFVPVAVDGEEAVAVERARAGGRSGV